MTVDRVQRSVPHGFESDSISGRDIVAFVAVVEAESVQGAAHVLGLTQSAVSKRVQSLERRAGVALLLRDRRGVWPTPAGHALYPKAKEALAALDAAAGVVTEMSMGDAHTIRIAASHTIGQFLLPSWLGRFRATNEDPDLHSEIHIVNSPGVVERLRRETVDIGFVEGVDDLRGLEALTLTWDELVVVVGPQHRWARRRSVRPRELADDGQYFTRERDSGTRSIAAGALAACGVELRPVLETESILGLKQAVLQDGFTLLSALTVEPEVHNGTLHAVSVEGADLRRPLRAVRRYGQGGGIATRRLWRFLQQQVDTSKP
jgi:DNA-binding transcriptional LysR family regulator